MIYRSSARGANLFRLWKGIVRHCLHIRVWLILTVLLFSGHDAFSEEPAFLREHRDYLYLFEPNDKHIALEYIFQPGNESESQGEFDQHKARLDVDYPLLLGADTAVHVGGSYEYRDLSFTDDYAAFDPEKGLSLHEISLATQVTHFLTTNTMVRADGAAGVYSDFEDGLTADAFQFQAGALLAYRINAGTTLVGGVRVSQDFGDTRLFPIVGVRLLSDDGRIHISITAPREAVFAYNASASRSWFVRYRLNGSIYRVTTGGAEFDIEVRDSRIGAGVNQWLGTHVLLTAELGATVGSRFKYDLAGTAFFDGSIDPAPFGLIGIGFLL